MSKEQTKVYIVQEDSFYNYLLKVEVDKKIITNLLFESEEKHPFKIRALMCEYYAILANLEELLNEIDDADFFSLQDKCYYVTEVHAIKFSVFLEALVSLKYKLSQRGHSISLH